MTFRRTRRSSSTWSCSTSSKLDLVIDHLNAQGDGVARHARQVITVPFTIPGEHVRVSVHVARDGSRVGTIEEVLLPSPHRVEPRCPHFGVPRADLEVGPYNDGGCGGCSWQHIAYAEQLRLKSEMLTRLVREAFRLLRETAGIRFIGNIEGRDLLAGHSTVGHIDVAVCDGFVGNILLKFYESVGRLLQRLLAKSDRDLLAHPDIQSAFSFLDYSQYGGAPLLGVKGISIVCHGSSPSNAIKHAIRVAVHSCEVQLDHHIQAEFAQVVA